MALEIPGPRLLLMVKARLLQEMPGLEGNAEGGLTTVVDLDFGRDRLTIGIIVNFDAKPLFSIRIPIEAFFDLKEGKNFHILVGTHKTPVHAEILGAFSGSGYLMISGHGLVDQWKGDGYNTDPPGNENFVIATGVHVQFVWGSVPAKIYARIAGGFNILVQFDPFYLYGDIYIEGELRLIIVGIGARARLWTHITERQLPNGKKEIEARLDGKICGRVNFFFFKVQACVDFGVGSRRDPPLPDLISKVSLVSRSPALLDGTGAEQPIDAATAEAIESISTPDLSDATAVAIDSMPTIDFSAPPVLASDSVVLGSEPGGASGATVGGFVPRGNQQARYEISSISLRRNGGGPVYHDGDAPKPSHWWTVPAPTDPDSTTQLALLTWNPAIFVRAIQRSEALDEIVRERWGNVCSKAAPAAPVLWTFNDEPQGPSEIGWRIDGVAWPDPSDSIRSAAPDTCLKVYECWRTGSDVDPLRGIVPATVIRVRTACARTPSETTPPRRRTTAPVGVLGFNVTPTRTATASEPVLAPEAAAFRLVADIERGVTLNENIIADAISARGVDQGVNIASDISSRNALVATQTSATISTPLSTVGATGVIGRRSINNNSAPPVDRNSATASSPSTTGQQTQCWGKLLGSTIFDVKRNVPPLERIPKSGNRFSEKIRDNTNN